MNRRGHGEAACHSCLVEDGDRSPPYLAVFDADDLHRRILAHPPASLSLVGRSSGNVFQLPDMKFSRNTEEMDNPLTSNPDS